MWCWMKQTGCLTWALSRRWVLDVAHRLCPAFAYFESLPWSRSAPCSLRLLNCHCCLSQVMRIVDSVRPDRQTVMFSATFPRAMEALARRILNKPIEVQVGGRSVVCSDVEQHVVKNIHLISVSWLFRRPELSWARSRFFFCLCCCSWWLMRTRNSWSCWNFWVTTRRGARSLFSWTNRSMQTPC